MDKNGNEIQHSINRVHKFGGDFLEIQGGGVRNNCFIPIDDNDVVQKNIPKLCTRIYRMSY